MADLLPLALAMVGVERFLAAADVAGRIGGDKFLGELARRCFADEESEEAAQAYGALLIALATHHARLAEAVEAASVRRAVTLARSA